MKGGGVTPDRGGEPGALKPKGSKVGVLEFGYG
jgi:hypothetical protein